MPWSILADILVGLVKWLFKKTPIKETADVAKRPTVGTPSAAAYYRLRKRRRKARANKGKKLH